MAEPSSPQRQRILDAAVAVLAQKGQGGLTVRTVALEAGYSTSGIYTWFGGKDRLLEAIYSDGFASFRAHIAAADTEPHPRTRLVRSAELYWHWALANPTHYLLMFAGVPGLFSPSPQAIADAELAFDDLVSRVIAFTGSAGADDTAHHYWATLHGYAMLQLAGPHAEPQEGFERFQRGLERLIEPHE